MLDPQYAGWGTKIGFLFGGLSILFWIPCYFLFPEVSDIFTRSSRSADETQSKGRTYTELDRLYASGIPVRHFAKEKLDTQEGAAVIGA